MRRLSFILILLLLVLLTGFMPVMGESYYLRVYFSSAIVNGNSLSASNPTITVSPGSKITGYLEAVVDNNRGGSWTTPVIGTVSWKRGWFSCISGDAPTGRSAQRFYFDLVAPNTPGTYYIGIFTGWMYSCDEVASNDHPATYGDGDDVWDMPSRGWDEVIANGAASTGPYHMPGRAIKVVVQSQPAPAPSPQPSCRFNIDLSSRDSGESNFDVARCSDVDGNGKRDSFVYINVPSGTSKLTITMSVESDDDIDMKLYSPAGSLVGSSTNGRGRSEAITVNNPAPGVWKLHVYEYSITGTANVRVAAGVVRQPQPSPQPTPTPQPSPQPTPPAPTPLPVISISDAALSAYQKSAYIELEIDFSKIMGALSPPEKERLTCFDPVAFCFERNDQCFCRPQGQTKEVSCPSECCSNPAERSIIKNFRLTFQPADTDTKITYVQLMSSSKSLQEKIARHGVDMIISFIPYLGNIKDIVTALYDIFSGKGPSQLPYYEIRLDKADLNDKMKYIIKIESPSPKEKFVVNVNIHYVFLGSNTISQNLKITIERNKVSLTPG